MKSSSNSANKTTARILPTIEPLLDSGRDSDLLKTDVDKTIRLVIELE